VLAGEGAGVDTLKEGSGIRDHMWYKGDARAEVVACDKLEDKRRGSGYWSSGVPEHRTFEVRVARAVRGKSSKSCLPSKEGDPK